MEIGFQMAITSAVMKNPPHKESTIVKHQIPHPRQMGYRPDIGAPNGQISDYRLQLRDGKSIHAREYSRTWGFHWDKIDPKIDAIEHLRRDAPEYYTLACTSTGLGAGALIGTATKKPSNIISWMIIGGLLGFFFGILTAEW